jgi:hypothetical protein
MLSTLELVGGIRHTLRMSVYFSGIAHYFDTPGGLAGAILSIPWVDSLARRWSRRAACSGRGSTA